MVPGKELPAQNDIGFNEGRVGFLEGCGGARERGSTVDRVEKSPGQNDVGQQGQGQQNTPAHKKLQTNACHINSKNATTKKLRLFLEIQFDPLGFNLVP